VNNEKKYVAIYHISNQRRFLLVTLDTNEHLISRTITLNSMATQYRHQTDVYKLFREMSIDDNTTIGLIDFYENGEKFNGQNREYFEQIIHCAQILIGFSISHFDLTHMAQRVNHYHKYIRHRDVTKSDVPLIYRKFIKSHVIKWINRRVELDVDNQSAVMRTAYMRTLVGLYYIQLKNRVNAYNKS